MLDGNTMTGRVDFEGFDTLLVRRADGGAVTIRKADARPATADDILAACNFFCNRGRN